VHVPFALDPPIRRTADRRFLFFFFFISIVLLNAAGQVKLADFGLAKVMANGLTVTTSFVGVRLPLSPSSTLNSLHWLV
jgi:serine/threonine protein kinase